MIPHRKLSGGLPSGSIQSLIEGFDQTLALWHITSQEFEQRFREAHQQLAQKYAHIQVLLSQQGEPLATLTQANAEQTHEKNCAKAGN